MSRHSLENYKTPRKKQGNNEIEVLQKQVATLTHKDLKALAGRKATEIFNNIQKVSSKIQKAKVLTKQAEDVKGSWNPFGKSKADKRSELNTQAINMQNEAMVEMNNLIQEGIKLTTISYEFAQAMTQTIAAMLENGFRDKDGHIQRLDGAAKEQVEFMLDEANKFVKHQQEYEERQEKQEEYIVALESGIAEHKEEYEKRQVQQENQIFALQSGINEYKEEFIGHKKAYEIRQEEQEQDIATQGQKIQELQKQLESKRTKIKELESALDSKKLIDEDQEAKINELQNRVRELEKNNGGKTSFIVSIIALLVGIGGIALQFLR